MFGKPTSTPIMILTSSSTNSSGVAYPSTDPNQNQNFDPFSNGPSVYLYGFLATLVLIFLVSIAVAWKGYRTRRLLRARIDEAIARGVLIPGYDPSNPNLPLFPATTRWRNAQVMTRPVMYEEWISAEKGDVEEGEEGEGRWDIKPTALDVLRPYDPEPLTSTTCRAPSHANSLLNQLLNPLRQYWFVQPPEGADPDQLQGRPGRVGRGEGGRRGGRGGRGTRGQSRDDRDRLDRLEEEQMEKKKMEESMGLLGVREVVASVFIVMPDRGHPAWGVRSAGVIADAGRVGGGGYGGGGGSVASGSRPSSWQQQGVASGSRPTSSIAASHAHVHGTSNSISSTAAPRASSSIGTTAGLEGERKEELPELVLGVVLLGLREETKEVVEEEGEGNGGALSTADKGKEPAVITPL